MPSAAVILETVRGMPVRRSLGDVDLQAVLPVDLKELRETLRKQHVSAAYLFGSRSRGTHRPDSDIDLLCILDSDHKTITALVDLEDAVGQLSPVGVDIATDINTVMKKHVARDLVKVL